MDFISASLGTTLRDIPTPVGLQFLTRRPGVGDVHRRTLECNRKRRPWGPPHGSGLIVGLRQVRDRRERPKPTDEMVARRNV